jgi:hypothetical protein
MNDADGRAIACPHEGGAARLADMPIVKTAGGFANRSRRTLPAFAERADIDTATTGMT